MRRLALIVIALLLAGGTAAWADAPAPSPPVTTTAISSSPLDTVVDYGELVRVSGTPEVCGLTQAPTRVRLGDKIWTKQEMSPIIFCWTSKTGKPILGGQVAMIYLIRGKTMVALTNWRKRGNMLFLYPKMIWSTESQDWGTVFSLDLQEIPLSADQVAGKVKKKTHGYMGREIVSREARQFSCIAWPGPPVRINCGRTGTWAEWSPVFQVSAPWRAQDVIVAYENRSCGCQSRIAYDTSGMSG